MVSTVLSVNLNKIALLRNSRGRDYPNLLEFARRTIALGVKSLTIHPRPDERHIRRQDALDLTHLLKSYPGVELNVEGYPSSDFIELVKEIKPDQVTLVPDGEQQITSDHGWDLLQDFAPLQQACVQLRPHAGRLAVFVDPGVDITCLVGVCERIELYTEAFAKNYALVPSKEDQSPAVLATLASYKTTAAQAVALDIGINAGHDLNLENLSQFLTVGSILEVSIGHALTVEALQFGWNTVIQHYLVICKGAASY